jgi:hypothetical protein
MADPRVSVLSKFALLAALALTAHAQSVISIRSGVVHYFEGAVTVAGHPLDHQLGKFPMIPEGAELRTEQGRAEVLLTPGVILRVGRDSAIRMVGTALADTRVELLEGAAMVNSDDPSPGNKVTLLYKNWSIRFQQRGVYRIDSDPPVMSVRQGEAEVSAGSAGPPVTVEHGMNLPLAAVLVPEQSGAEVQDGLTEWDRGRSQSIVADNTISSQISDDPDALDGTDPGFDGLTYFPMVGLSAAGLSSPALYGAYGLYQPGFNSLYLPGFAYRPMILLVGPRGYRGIYGARPLRISPGLSNGVVLPSGIIQPSIPRSGGPIRTLGPSPTIIRPATPAIRPVGPVGARGIHR